MSVHGYLKGVVKRHTYETGYEVAYAAMAIIAAGSAYAQYEASNEQADAANKAAWADYNNKKSALQEQANQVTASANNETNERYKQEMLDKSKIRTLSGESGAAGLSLDRLINDADFQSQMDMQTIVENKANKIKQNSLDSTAAFSRAASSQNVNDSQRVSELGMGLQIAGSTANAYAGYSKATKAK